MDQAIIKEMWVRWDGLQTHNPTTQWVQPIQSVSKANDINYDSDSTIAYDLEEVMNMEYENNSIIVTIYQQALMRSLEP